MEASTPRFAGITLRLAARALRTTPLPRLLSRLIVERKLRELDFASEGDPTPFWAPRSWKPRP